MISHIASGHWLYKVLTFTMVFNRTQGESTSRRKFPQVRIDSPSRLMPSARHFCRRQCWQRLRLVRSIRQFLCLEQEYIALFCWLLRKKPLMNEKERKKKVKKRLHFHFLYVCKLRIKSYIKDYIVKSLLHFKLTLKLHCFQSIGIARTICMDSATSEVISWFINAMCHGGSKTWMSNVVRYKFGIWQRLSGTRNTRSALAQTVSCGQIQADWDFWLVRKPIR